jgi:acylphosphatase
MAKIRTHLIIEGKVQGVWFRDSTRQQANEEGVFGWVKNRPDGRVEALFEGPEHQVKKMVSWCHHGPPSAHVTQVHETAEEYTGEFNTFDIVYR